MKIGDRVKVVKVVNLKDWKKEFAGESGEIVEVNEDEDDMYPYEIKFDNTNLQKLNLEQGTILWNDKEIELIEEPKQYKGWEILKMVDEGKLKEHDKIINQENKEIYIILHDTNDKLWFLDKKGWKVDSELIHGTFTIQEKKYMTFVEAVKTEKKLKHKDDNTFHTLEDIIYWINNKIYNGINYIHDINKKVWEVEE